MTYDKNKAKVGIIVIGLLILFAIQTSASELSMISINQLKLILDNQKVIIIDVRGTEDWQSSDVKIKGAVRRAPQNYESWAGDLPKDKALVLY